MQPKQAFASWRAMYTGGFGHVVHGLFSQVLSQFSRVTTHDALPIPASLTSRFGGRSSLFCFKHLLEWAISLVAAKPPWLEPPNSSAQQFISAPQCEGARLQPSAHRTSPRMLRHTSAYQLDQKADFISKLLAMMKLTLSNHVSLFNLS